ncbi:MAG: O-antigen ligase family protein, partial [Myxococcales bacterium]|nr:O-antigen ligase family protein [Myxococcales bacterium]
MPRRPRPLLTVSAVLSALTVLAAPLALGGTHWPTILALSGLALAAMLAAVAARRDGLRSHWIVWVAWAVAALVGAQLIPLPAGLLHHLSPRAAELHAAAGSASGPLSLSAPATWIAFALQVGFAALLTAVVQLDRRRGRWVADGLAVGGLAVVLVSAVHFAFGFHTIYGVFRPQDAAQMSGFFGPFINPNTQAGYLVLVGLVGLGIAVDATSDRRTRLGLAAAVFALLGAMASGSRGGQAAALFGGLLFAGLAYLRGQHRGDNTREKARQVAKATVALLALGGVAAVLLLPDWMAFDPSHPASDGKLAAWPGAVAHARAFWLAGSGRGAFEYVHPLFQSVSGQGTVTHPENHLLQLAADLGLPLAIATVAAFVGAWIDAVRRLDRRTAPAVWGVLAGLAAVGCQQLVDFGL